MRFLILSGLFLFQSGCFGPKQRPLAPEASARPSELFASPLKGARLLSPFGPRGRRYHTGIDLQLSRKGGEPVRASRAGRIMRATTMSGYGKIVEIKHADGFSSRYAHMKKIYVNKGQRVKKGTVLGTVGRTGRATTPHVHFEILTPQYRFVDPTKLLD